MKREIYEYKDTERHAAFDAEPAEGNSGVLLSIEYGGEYARVKLSRTEVDKLVWALLTWSGDAYKREVTGHYTEAPCDNCGDLGCRHCRGL
jgi:hypothetical protein